MNLPDFLTRDATGDVRFRDHRIGLYHVVQYYNDGYSAEMLACQFPTLPLALIHNAIGYYLGNKAEVDAYVAGHEATLREQRAANPKTLPVAELRERLATMRGAETA